MTVRKTVGALALVVGLFAAYSSSALAADTLTPSPLVLTLQAGQSTTVNKSLHLDGLPARADIIVAIDTTGSMGTALANAKADAVQICTDVQAAIPGARFAAVEFQDYPIDPYGNAGDVAYELHTTYTSSCAAFSAGVAAMTLGIGGDFPEANNRVHFEAYSDAALLAARDPLATRFLVMLADDRPHSTTTFGSCANTGTLSDPGRNGVNESGGGDDLETQETIDGLNADDHTLLYISYIGGASALPCHESLAAATGGDAVADEDAEDIGAFIVAQAELVPYSVNLAVGGQCPPVGLTFNPVPPYGPFTGEQTILFTETITAPTVPGIYTCTVTAVMTPGGPTTAVQTITLRVLPGDPATLVLTPETDTNTVDDQHCVTATVKDAFGNPTPNINVRFSVAGSVTTSGTAMTNAAGQAQFCYTGPALPGADVITAYADTDNDNVNDAAPADPEDTARKVWVIPASTPGCKVTYGGRITAANGDKATFGGNAKADDLKGQEEYQDHGPAVDLNVHSINVQSVVCSADGTQASIFGTATINGGGTFDYRIDLKDLGEPGTSDTYRIRLSNGYDSGTQVLEGGNVQIH